MAGKAIIDRFGKNRGFLIIRKINLLLIMNSQEETVSKIPTLTSKASPCDGIAFQERLKEELVALISVFSAIILLMILVCKTKQAER